MGRWCARVPMYLFILPRLCFAGVHGNTVTARSAIGRSCEVGSSSEMFPLALIANVLLLPRGTGGEL